MQREQKIIIVQARLTKSRVQNKNLEIPPRTCRARGGPAQSCSQTESRWEPRRALDFSSLSCRQQ